MEDKSINNQCVSRNNVVLGEFVFNTLTGQLSAGDKTIQLEPQVSTLLKYFIERAGDIVSKEDIFATLWAGRVVSDDAFRAVIKKLRKALSDDARSPDYLQTIPLKGYRLIAQVTTQTDNTVPYTEKYKYFKLFGAFSLVAALVVASLVYFDLSPNKPELELLTNMDGSELRHSFNDSLNQLVFSHRQNKDDYLQLYTKSLDSGVTRRLTFDEANYSNGHLSRDGRRLAYTRSTPSSSETFIADFSPEAGLSNVQALPANIAEGRYLLTWSASGEGLYLSDLLAPESSKGISYYDLNTETLSRLTDPGGFGGGDIFARESYDGEHLAILRNLSANGFELIILHLATGEMTHVVPLPTHYTQLVWDQSGSDIILSSFYGDFARYTIDARHLEVLDVEASNVNDVFYSCGSGCVYARQHDGNYLDLEYQPNPFANKQVSFETHMQSEGAESFPVFGPRSNGIYYANKYGTETQIVHSVGASSKVLTSFPIDATIMALQVNADETRLSGIVNNRLFVIDMASSVLNYLSTELEMVVSTHWHAFDDALYFARIEKNVPVLYRYEFDEDIRVREAPGRYAQLALPEGQALIIDENLTVWIESTDHPPRYLTQMAHPSPNRWKVNNNALYYTTRKENLAYLHKIDLVSGNAESKLLAKNRYQIQFDLSKDGLSLIGVRSILAQSDTVKMRF